MSKSFKRTIGFVVAIFIVAFGAVFLFGSYEDYVRITDVDYQAVVVDEPESEGKVVITERLTFDIHAASENNLFWELWRELPEAYYDGAFVHYNVLSVKEILEDGSEKIYTESPVLYWGDEDFIDDSGELGPGKYFHSEGPYDDYYFYESLIFYVDGLYREKVVFEIEYEMFNATLRYGDASELYLAMYSGDTTKYLKSFNGEILIPSDKMAKPGNYDAYTYGTNAHEFEFIESDTLHDGYHTFKFELDEDDLKFKKYNEYLEFALITHGSDKHVFSEYASNNYYYNDDMLDSLKLAQTEYEQLPALYAQRKTTTFVSVSLISAAIVALFIIVLNRFKAKYKLYQPTIVLDYFRDIPSDLDANFARKLVFSDRISDRDDADGYAAAMLSLAHKGYLEVVVKDENKQMRSNNFMIKLKDSVSERETLSIVEKQYYDLIVRHAKNSDITLTEFQKKVQDDYEYTNSFVNNVKKSLTKIGVDEGYFQIADYKKAQKSMTSFGIFFIVISIVMMIGGNLIAYQNNLDLAYGAFFILGAILLGLGIYLIIKAKTYILLTQFGVDEKVKWKGLFDFLNNETLMVERGVTELAIWEKYLIYATVFGISDKVIKALRVVLSETVINQSPILANRIYTTQSFRSSARSFSSSTRSATFTHSTGGHGGYGGGGRGGGGGGGGH